jgi:hypothetical protein
MAIQQIGSSNALKFSRENLAVVDSYIDSNLSVGTTVYLDEAKTLLVGQQEALGVIKGKNLYSVKTDSNSKIVSSELIKQRLLGWHPVFVEDNQDQKEDEIDQAFAAGCDFFQFSISFDKIYLSKAEWDADLDIYWEKYTRIYNKVKNLFPNFGVRINCITDDTSFYINRDNSAKTNINQALFRYCSNFGDPVPFYADSDMVMDQFGMPIRAKSGWGRPTMFKQSARLIMVEFVKRVILRFPDIFSKCLWLSVPTTSDHEMGLEYIQSWTGTGFATGSHPEGFYCLVDYHPLSQSYFKDVFLPNKYGNIQALNLKWGKGYLKFSDVEIPKVQNVSNITQTSFDNFQSLSNSNAFIDWQQHNVKGLEIFWKECSDIIKQYAPKVEYCYEVGSSTDKDSSIFRGTQNLLNVRKICSVFKAQYEKYTWDKVPSISSALGRKNWNGDIYKEVNSNDVPTQSNIKDTFEVQKVMYQNAIEGYENDIKCAIMICRNDNNNNISTNGTFGTNQFSKTLQVIKDLRKYIDSGLAFSGVKINKTITQKLSDRTKNWDDKNREWIANGGVNCSIIMEDDLGSLDVNVESLNLYQLNNDSSHTEIQTYTPSNLAKVEILEETYTYTEDESFNYLHCMHSITQYQSIQDSLKSAMCNLIVKGKTSGKIYARTTQNSGSAVKNAIRDDMTIASGMASTTIKAGNNHPQIDYIPTLYRDSKVKIKPNEELIFRWENVGTASVEISLIAPDPPVAYPNLKYIEQCLAPGTSFEYIFNPNRSELQGEPRWKRAIKSNMNAILSCNP